MFTTVVAHPPSGKIGLFRFGGQLRNGNEPAMSRVDFAPEWPAPRRPGKKSPPPCRLWEPKL
jgi:hypothetical protein